LADPVCMEISKVSIVEHEHMAEMEQNLKRKLTELQVRDGSRLDSLKSGILGLVVADSYDAAKEELMAYIEARAEYPGFQFRAQRYGEHCCELIQAIKTKRNFPGLANLALAKQQDMHEKILHHFEELKRNLTQIEKLEREQKMADMRSTVWIVRSFTLSLIAVFVAYFMIDLQAGMFSSVFRVCDVGLDNATTWLVQLVGM
jgi:hypothetical protein